LIKTKSYHAISVSVNFRDDFFPLLLIHGHSPNDLAQLPMVNIAIAIDIKHFEGLFDFFPT
jgi:hypothetical protein